MRERQATKLSRIVQRFYSSLFRAFPAGFRAEYGEEMAAVLGERLAAAAEQRASAVIALGVRELWQLPAALLRAHLYRWQKKRKRASRLFSQRQGRPLFGIPPVDDDGRFSRRSLLRELSPFILSVLLVLQLTYWPPAWLPATRRDPLDSAVVWAGMLPLLPFLLGLVRGMPRWAYPYGGLMLGYSLLAASQQRIAWLWWAGVATTVCLAMMAALLQRGERPLPSFFQRVGASVALDWTRLSFGVFGAAPVLVIAAFDNGYLNNRTPYLALALLLMLLTVILYGRSRRQGQQLAALVGGSALLVVPALLDDLAWRGQVASLPWLAMLWAGTATLLLLPLLAVLLQQLPLGMVVGQNGEE